MPAFVVGSFALALSAFERIARGGGAGFARVALVAETRFEVAFDPHPQFQFGSLGSGALGCGTCAGRGIFEFDCLPLGAEFDRAFVVGGRTVAVSFGASAVGGSKALRRAQTRGALLRLISRRQRVRFGLEHGVEAPFHIDARTDLFGEAAAMLARAVVEAAVFFAQLRHLGLGGGRALARGRVRAGRSFGHERRLGELALEAD
jgi:hypothetical protein